MYLHRLDPEAHMKDSPSALELAAIEGFRETFALLAGRLKIDSNNDWLKLAQVHDQLMFFATACYIEMSNSSISIPFSQNNSS